LDFHLIPGWFSESCDRVLARLAAGSPVRLADPAGGEVQFKRRDAPGESVPTRWMGVARVAQCPPLAAALTVWAEPTGRALLSLSIDPPPKGSEVTAKDLELSLLGLACAALAKESQGAVILGHDLGPVGAGLERATLAEQVQQLLALHGESIEVIVIPEDTARSLPSLIGFEPRRLGNLLELRRV
jgi:hypothetical protein